MRPADAQRLSNSALVVGGREDSSAWQSSHTSNFRLETTSSMPSFCASSIACCRAVGCCLLSLIPLVHVHDSEAASIRHHVSTLIGCFITDTDGLFHHANWVTGPLCVRLVAQLRPYDKLDPEVFTDDSFEAFEVLGFCHRAFRHHENLVLYLFRCTPRRCLSPRRITRSGLPCCH